MVDVCLHGRLADQFGPRFRLAIRSLGEAVRALDCNFPGRFRRELEQGEYRIVRGQPDDGQDMRIEDVDLLLGRTRELHIVPVVAGAKSGGLGQIIVGAVLVAAAVAMTVFAGPAGVAFGVAAMQGTTILGGMVSMAGVAMMGGMMILGGVVQMMSPTPKLSYDAQNKPDQRASFIFDGPTNTSAQGVAMPMVYGKMRVGSIMVSSSITNARK